MNLRSAALLSLCGVLVFTACGDSEEDSEVGDPRSQALSYARDDIACTSSEQCCAVLDGCLAQFLIVSSGDQASVEQLLASADKDACLACIPPMVQVDCLSGKCVGLVLESTGGLTDDLPVDFIKTHCGRIDLPEGWVAKPASNQTPASFQPKAVIGC